LAARRRGRRGVAAIVLVVLVGLVLLGGLLRVRVDTPAESALPSADPTLVAVQGKARDFGGDPVIVLLRYPRPRQFVSDSKQLYALLRLEGSLAGLPDVATVYGPATVLNQLAEAARNFVIEIAGRRDGVRRVAEDAARQAGKSPAEVTAAGQAAVDQVNQRYAPLLIRGLPIGLPTLDNPRFAQAVMFGPDGLPKPAWRFIVPGTDAVAVLVRPRENLDQAGSGRLLAAIRATVADAKLDTATVTISGVPTVTEELATEVGNEVPMIGALVAIAVLLRYLLVPAPGGRWHRLRPLVASMLGSAATLSLIGWLRYPLSFGAVVLLPLLLGVGSSFPLYLAATSNRRRVLVMSVASASGFLALGLSPLPFVRDLGITLAGGILLTVAVALLLNRYWPPTTTPEPAQLGKAEVAVGDTDRFVAATRDGRRLGKIAIALSAAALAALGWVVLPQIALSADPLELAKGLPALSDATTVESTLGASGEISVELAGPDVLQPAALRWANQAYDVLTRFGDQLRPVVGVTSLFAFLGPDPTPDQINGALALMPPDLSSSVVRPDRQVAQLVYGVKLQDLGAQQRMLAEVGAVLPTPPPGYRAQVVGLPVAAARGYQLLGDNRYLANLAGIAVAGLVLALGLRRRWDACRAVAAAALATGWGLAALWALGVGLSPLTVALGSLVSVTGCEFVVLLAQARRRRDPWLPRSVAFACATSVLGYLALVPSRLWLIREFGLILAVAVVLSYLAAELVLRLFPPGRGPASMVVPGEPAYRRDAAAEEVGV
jgi:hypothetical protein